MMICKELFPIEFNSKKFMVFSNENGKRTFLQIDDLGEYEYPTLEDYLELYKIFNITDSYTSYFVPSFKFDSCVKATKKGVLGLLAVVTLGNSIPNAMALGVDVKVTDDSLIITETYTAAKKRVVVINDVEDLNKYLGYVNLTKSSILKAIEENENIPKDIKEIGTEEFLNTYEKHPNANYRVFFENVSTLNVNVFSSLEYYKRFPAGSSANYNRMTNTINLIEGASKANIAHELAHIYDSFYREMEDVIISRSETYTALNEGMKELMVDSIVPSDGATAYKTGKEVLKFLMYATDFTYEEYSRYGLTKLFNKAATLYPEVDFKYINSTLNSMHAATIYNVKVVGNPVNMYNELFKVCLSGASKETGYESFNRFLYIFDTAKVTSLVDEYFETYTKKLEKLGYSSQKIKAIQAKLKAYDKANAVLYIPTDESAIDLGYEDDDYNLSKIDENGEHPLTKDVGEPVYQSLHPGKFDLFKLKVFTHGKDLKNSLVDVLKEIKNFSPSIYTSIPIYMDGKLLTTAMPGNMRIQVGFTKDGEVGFFILDQDGEYIYKSDDNLSTMSNMVPMDSYLACYDKYYLDELELSDVLNESFLIENQSTSTTFCNFDVEDGKIIPGYSRLVAVIRDINGRELCEYCKVSESKVYVKDAIIFASSSPYDSDYYDYVIDLEKILNFGNIFKDGQFYYAISEEKLEDLTMTYIESLNLKVNKKL